MEELEREVGSKTWAEAIVRAMTKAVRAAKAQPGGSDEAEVKVRVDVRRGTVVDVRRVVEEVERVVP